MTAGPAGTSAPLGQVQRSHWSQRSVEGPARQVLRALVAVVLLAAMATVGLLAPHLSGASLEVADPVPVDAGPVVVPAVAP